MAKALEQWSVLPHEALTPLTASVLTVTGTIPMPLTKLERRMTVVRLQDGRLVVYSAIALDEPQMSALEDFGRPAFLVVPNEMHRRDAYVWKQRYPRSMVIAAAGARTKVDEVVPVDTCTPDFGDDAVRFVEVAGTGGRESALEVHEGGQITLVLNDVVGNLPKESGMVLRALGFAGDRPRIPRMAKRMLVQDAHALRAQLEGWAEQPVERILVSHGRPIVTNAREALREMARSL